MSRFLRIVRESALTLAAIAGVICVLSVVAGALTGIKPIIFVSNSMSPSMPTGTLALVRTVPAADLQVGQVVSVDAANDARVTHRIVTIHQEGGRTELTLKGDANPAPDQARYPVTKADLVIWSQPGLGKVVRGLSMPPVVFAVGLVVGLWLGWWLPKRTNGDKVVCEEYERTPDIHD